MVKTSQTVCKPLTILSRPEAPCIGRKFELLGQFSENTTHARQSRITENIGVVE